MRSTVKAIRYRNLDEARKALREAAGGNEPPDPFDDGGSEPEGLLSVVTEDLVGEELFYRLFDSKKGTLLDVVRKRYSGFGPPAEADDYMGFPTRGVCYVLAGAELPVEIEGCPEGARDLHHLEAMVLDRKHSLNREDLARRLKLPQDWSFDDLFELIRQGRAGGTEIDRLIHRGVQ